MALGVVGIPLFKVNFGRKGRSDTWNQHWVEGILVRETLGVKGAQCFWKNEVTTIYLLGLSNENLKMDAVGWSSQIKVRMQCFKQERV